MSDKRANAIGRRREFRRRLRGEKKGVSPVVATLILILIAVAAAAALYLWLVAWQGGVTSGIGSPKAQYTVTIGGSTSVYPFATTAANWFEQNNSDVVISVNQGGSGAGMAAVCSGQVDIGEASAYYSATTLETSDGCPSTLNEQIIAYDGVDVITPTANLHGLQSMSWDTLQSIVSDLSATAPTSGIQFIQSAGTLTMDGNTWTAALAPSQGTGFAWDQIPACAEALSGGTCAGLAFGLAAAGAETGSTAVPGTMATCTGFADDLCDAAPADATPCGWTVCAGGTAAAPATHAIVFHYRSDVSGTTQSFLARLVAAATTSESYTAATSLQFTGCGGDNQFDGCGMSLPTSGNGAGAAGNPAVISGVAGDANGLGYASDGLVQTPGSNVVPVDFQGYGQSVVVNVVGESVALSAIALGITDFNANSASYATAQAYIGWRPFLNVETTPPTGEVLRYLQFVMDPANNENIASAAAEISVYASGLAGHVPVTPVTGYQVTV